MVFQKYLTKENTLSKKVLPNQMVGSQEKKEVMRNLLLFLINNFFKDVTKELKI